MAGRLLMIKFIKMKKKIIFAVATGFFAVATVFNMNMLQGNIAGDVSLDAISIMAQAQSEIPETETSIDCLYCGGDGVSPGGSSCTYCGGGDRDRNNSNWGGLFHYPTKGGNPKECTLYIEVDAGGRIVSQSTFEITANFGYTVRKTKGMKETCPFDTGTGCTVYSCQLTN
jgi:hypothetical protein